MLRHILSPGELAGTQPLGVYSVIALLVILSSGLYLAAFGTRHLKAFNVIATAVGFSSLNASPSHHHSLFFVAFIVGAFFGYHVSYSGDFMACIAGTGALLTVLSTPFRPFGHEGAYSYWAILCLLELAVLAIYFHYQRVAQYLRPGGLAVLASYVVCDVVFVLVMRSIPVTPQLHYVYVGAVVLVSICLVLWHHFFIGSLKNCKSEGV